MLFNSLDFLIFFPITTWLYFVLPQRYRGLFLLLASCIFYMFFIPVYILILGVTILIDYWAGRFIETSRADQKKVWLWSSVLATCLVLFVFKYFNFFSASIAAIGNFFGATYSVATLSLILPIGLSFHTFQSLSYVIEVYRGRQKAEKNFWTYALYVMFYPQLVAGPIERPQNLLKQFYEKHEFLVGRVVEGLQWIVWGFFKKMVIADRLAIFVNAIYAQPQNYSGPYLLMGTVFFAFQIYCDFSGYTDIARGCAKVLGFRLMQNFDQPYTAKSISEFWRRWHISLSTWFRDYVYIPLGGKRGGSWQWSGNLMLVFLLSGLWHGANWTFVAWGALNGFYMVFSVWTQPLRAQIEVILQVRRYLRLYQVWNVAVTFSLVCFAWIFFRAHSIHDAFYIVKNLGSGWTAQVFNIPAFKTTLESMGSHHWEFGVALISIIFLQGLYYFQRHHPVDILFQKLGVFGRWSIYTAAVLIIVIFGVYQKNQFIYFQF
jgi:D-alanyl-lipoteichoic acid acyltransferase DltB (MBOAT superfamily)